MLYINSILINVTLLFSNNMLLLFSNDMLFFIITYVTSLITGYIVLRERLVKTEIRLDNVYDYINNRNELLETKIKALVEDLEEFRQISKEATKTLYENTVSVNELKIMLRIVSEKLQKF